MDDRQENRLGSYRTTGEVLTENAVTFAGVPAFVTQHQMLLDSISLIDALAASQGTNTTGVTAAKKEMMRQMKVWAMRVAGALTSYASVQGNDDLKAKAKLNDSMFTEARDDARDDVAQVVHDAANANVAALADYGVTAATLTALQTRIDAYRLVIPSPSVARSNRRGYTELLDTELRRSDTICKERLDGLMEQFHYEADGKTPTQFYLAYQAARDIIDTGSHKKKPPTP